MTVYVVDLDDPDRRGFSLETVLSASGGLVGPLGAVWVSFARLMYWNPAEPIVHGVNPLAVVANS